MWVNIFIQSKQKHHLYNFIKAFNLKNKTHLKSIIFFYARKKCKKKFSILTSPHVNKRAQEQFGVEIYRQQLKINVLEPLKFIILLKRVCSNSFPNLKLAVKFETSNKTRRNFSINKNYLKKKPKRQNYHRQTLMKIVDNNGA